MARRLRSPQRSDLVSTITETIANHPRLSAAVAFQMGILLGQAMNTRASTFRALKRGVGAAPAAIASALPDFGFFDTESAPAPAQRKRRHKAARRGRRKARSA